MIHLIEDEFQNILSNNDCYPVACEDSCAYDGCDQYCTAYHMDF